MPFQTKLLVTISTDKPHNVSKYCKIVELGRLSSQVTHQFFRQQSGISEEVINLLSNEPVREKTNNLGPDKVRHKTSCTVTEDG